MRQHTKTKYKFKNNIFIKRSRYGTKNVLKTCIKMLSGKYLRIHSTIFTMSSFRQFRPRMASTLCD